MRLRFEKVSFTYPSGVRALNDVNLEIGSGEMVAIVGENGAGKTTLVKLLNALLRPGQGKVLVGDWDTADHTTAELAARVGFLFQNPDEQLFEHTVAREVAFGPRNLRLSEGTVASRVRNSLKAVNLHKQSKRSPYDLPPTDRKLLALAATLAMDTPVLVLDEPSIGQDAAGRARLIRIFRKLNTMGHTLVLISHDLDFCAQLAGRVVVMADGRILADGSASEVFAQGKLLAKAAVTPPQLVRLAQALKMPASPLTVKEFVRSYS
ncbi:MAG: ATP-binding cassette domain-containing protein, partial [Anaerolineales bacterium]